MADVFVQYKDGVIAELEDSGTKVLNTSGKYCESDITIQYNKPTSEAASTNFKRWDITVTSGIPSSGAFLTLLTDDWLKENRTNPTLCVSVIPKFTISGDSHIQGVFLGTNMILANAASTNYYSLSAYKHSNDSITARMRKYALSAANNVGDLNITSNGKLQVIATSSYPMAVGDYVVIAFIA